MPDVRRIRKFIKLSIILILGGIILCLVPFIYIHSRYPIKFKDQILKNATEFRIDPALIAAVIYEESRFKVDSKSSAGALGLMQLMPETTGFIATQIGEPVPADITDPIANLRFGSWYLRYLLDRNNQNEKNALAAYNAGPSNVENWQSQGKSIQFKETQNFIARIEKSKKIYKRYYFRGN